MGDQDFKIPVWVDEEFLLKVLCTKFKTEDVQVHSFKVEVGTNKGDGFASEMFSVLVESSLGTFPLLLKKPHEIPERREMVQGFDLYTREIFFYERVCPEIQEILESVDEFEVFAPEMFYAERQTDLLVLRDLRGKGYKTGDRNSRVPKEHAEMVLRKLAKFHAASLVLNKKWSGELEKQNFKLFDGPFNDVISNNIRALAKEMVNWGSDFEAMIPKLQDCADNYSTLGRQSILSKQGLNLLIHGDPWFNNLLLKAEPESDALLIDFQTVSWASLGIDLVYFSITSLNEEDFENREDFLRIYHSHLERVLKKLSWKDVPTFDEVLAEYKNTFFHAFYSVTAKCLTATDPSEQSIESFLDNQEDDVLRRLRIPRINKELKTTIKLLNEYGALDKRIE